MHTCLDFRSIHLGATGISAHALKRDAIAAAKAAGWQAKDVSQAANRFSRFWVICQGVGSETLRVLTRDGWIDMPYPGMW